MLWRKRKKKLPEIIIPFSVRDGVKISVVDDNGIPMFIGKIDRMVIENNYRGGTTLQLEAFDYVTEMTVDLNTLSNTFWDDRNAG